MNDYDFLKTRREFLRTSALGASTAWTVPMFLGQTFDALHAAATDKATQTTTGKDGTILVVLQLAGGNDGLNTIVPHADDAYYKARPQLGVAKNDVLKIDDQLGFNPGLSFLAEQYKEGELAVVQGVGYPNPNRSHFRSTEIWQCATDSNRVSPTGWLGRYFDHHCAGAGPDPTTGIAISQKQPQSFFAKQNPGISLSQPQLYRWIQGRRPDDLAEAFFRDLNRPEAEMADGDGASIAEVSGGKMRIEESSLDYLERVALDAQLSSDQITKISASRSPGPRYPASKLARSLQLVSRMIAGKMPTRVYYVSHGGFDTHQNQVNSHPRLLQQLDEALKVFVNDLKKQGNYKRIVLMTFSEFGRRVAQNFSNGTDHGTAAPLFVTGGAVKGGLYGKHPSLVDLDDGDLRHTTDFRSVYATVLDQWLKAPSETVLGQKFKRLKFLG